MEKKVEMPSFKKPQGGEKKKFLLSHMLGKGCCHFESYKNSQSQKDENLNTQQKKNKLEGSMLLPQIQK